METKGNGQTEIEPMVKCDYHTSATGTRYGHAQKLDCVNPKPYESGKGQPEGIIHAIALQLRTLYVGVLRNGAATITDGEVLIGNILKEAAPRPAERSALEKLPAYFEERAEENSRRADTAELEINQHWHSAKADTYRRAAQKLRQALSASLSTVYGDEDWRVGRKVRTNVYAGERPVCQCHSEFDASLIVAAVNGVRHASPSATGEPREIVLLREHDRIGWRGHEVLYEMIEGKSCPTPKASLGLATSAVDRLLKCVEKAERELAEARTRLETLGSAHVGVCAELAEARKELDKCGKDMCFGQRIEGVASWVRQELYDEQKALADQREAALRKYGAHLDGCSTYKGPYLCTCGLAEALASAPADFAHITHDIDKITEDVIAASAPAKEEKE